jgi:hypothetical protein
MIPLPPEEEAIIRVAQEAHDELQAIWEETDKVYRALLRDVAEKYSKISGCTRCFLVERNGHLFFVEKQEDKKEVQQN